MLKVLLASVAAIGLFGASAFAADMPTKAPPSKIRAAAPPTIGRDFMWAPILAEDGPAAT